MDFLAEEFRLGETDFKVRKFPALEGWRVLERIRAEIGRALDADMLQLDDKALQAAKDGKLLPTGESAGKPDLESMKKQITGMVRLILGLSPEFVDNLRTTMNTVMFFKNKVAKDWMPVTGSEDTAYMSLTPLDLYWLLARSLAVNFFDSFRNLLGGISFERPSSKQ